MVGSVVLRGVALELVLLAEVLIQMFMVIYLFSVV